MASVHSGRVCSFILSGDMSKWALLILTLTWLPASLCQSKRDLEEEALTLAEWGSYNVAEPDGPGTYAFGFDVDDPAKDNVQFRSEEKHSNGSVTGTYGYLQKDGNAHVVHYIADERGYRATIEENSSEFLRKIFLKALSAVRMAGKDRHKVQSRLLPQGLRKVKPS